MLWACCVVGDGIFQSLFVMCLSLLYVVLVLVSFFGDGFHVPLSDVRAWLQESMASQSYFESYFW